MSFVGSSGWSGSTYSSRLPLPLVSRMNGVQPCDFTSSPVSSNILRFSQPMTPGPVTAAAGPQRLVGVLGEDQVMRREAGADQRELARRRIVHGQMAVGVFEREHLRRRMVRALLAEVRIGRRTHPRGEPDASLLVHHRVVIAGLAVPDRVRLPSTARAPSASPFDDGVFGSRTGYFHLGRRMRHRIEDRHVIRAVLPATRRACRWR